MTRDRAGMLSTCLCAFMLVCFSRVSLPACGLVADNPRGIETAADDVFIVDSVKVSVDQAAGFIEYKRALNELGNDRAAASLVHFAAAETLMHRSWTFYLNYGQSLKAASTEAVRIAGRRESVVRFSLQRMEMLQRALQCYKRAESLAPGGRARAVVFRAEGVLLDFVGSPLESAACFGRAAQELRTPGMMTGDVERLFHMDCGTIPVTH